MELKELIDFCINRKRTVCFVGGGGKTTLMYFVAREVARQGKKVIVSTTTHIMRPEINYASNMADVEALWAGEQYSVIGAVDEMNVQKLVFSNDMYEAVKGKADLILLEADGTRRLPCKVPAEHEPAIVDDCDLVIGVMGMSALGKAMKECCFRFEQEGTWLGVNGETLLDEEIAENILSSELGTRKSVGNRDYVVVLNQCDDGTARNRAHIISAKLKEKYGIASVCCSLKAEVQSEIV